MKNRKKALDYFKKHPGIHKTGEILAAGIYRRSLYGLRDSGDIIQVGYGLYRLAGEEPDSKSVYAELSIRIPKGIFCLISALDFHEIGTQVPYDHWVALPAGAHRPKIREYSVNFCFFKDNLYDLGLEKHNLGGNEIKVYCPAKTVVDCFKYRNKIGLEVAIEALRESLRAKKATIPEIIKFAEICRMKNVMMPYLEVI